MPGVARRRTPAGVRPCARPRPRADRAAPRPPGQAGAYEDYPQPYCTACGASIGIFTGRGDAWLHYTGEGTAASPVELYDAGHEPAVAWRGAALYACCENCEHDDGMPKDEHRSPCRACCNDGREGGAQ